MEQISKMPVIGNILNIIDTYPRISAWVVLSAGMLGLLYYEAQDVGLTTRNWIALTIASLLVAALSIWIVSWEDEELDAEAQEKSKVSEEPAESEETTEEEAE